MRISKRKPVILNICPRARFSLARTILAILLLGALSGCQSKESGPPPPEVTVARPIVQAVTDYLEFTGNTAATDSVNLVARVEGYLQAIHFVDGARVKKGDLLFTIQQAQYKAQLQQAQAQVSAQKAALWHAKRELARYTSLLKEDAATQTDVDHWQYEKDSSQAALLGAEAQVELAKLNLDYTIIRAPFDGRIGRHLVNPAILSARWDSSRSLLRSIASIRCMFISLSTNEISFASLPGTRISPARDSRKGRYPYSSSFQMKTIILTPDCSTLPPGGFANDRNPAVARNLSQSRFNHTPGSVRASSRAGCLPRDALMVPGEAVSFDQQGEYFLVVNDKNLVERRGRDSRSPGRHDAGH